MLSTDKATETKINNFSPVELEFISGKLYCLKKVFSNHIADICKYSELFMSLFGLFLINEHKTQYCIGTNIVFWTIVL
jgi:hypothetical protein